MNSNRNYGVTALAALTAAVLLAVALIIGTFVLPGQPGWETEGTTEQSGSASLPGTEITGSDNPITVPESETVPVTGDVSTPATSPEDSVTEPDSRPDTEESETLTTADSTTSSSDTEGQTAPAESTAGGETPSDSRDNTEAVTAEITTSPEETSPPAVTRKMKVGISPTTATPGTNVYVDAAKAAGFETVILPTVKTEAEAARVLAGIDAIMLTGGEDIDPKWYGEAPLYDKYGHNVNSINAPRDTSDMLYIKGALELDMPMLAVCRGMQLLNVACGGTLYQDIPMQVGSQVTHRDPAKAKFVTHLIDIEKGSILNLLVDFTVARVNSWHHQAVKDVGEGLVVTARSQGDGIVECIEMPDKLFVLGTQFHPEQLVRQSGFGVYKNVFAELYKKAVEYANKH